MNIENLKCYLAVTNVIKNYKRMCEVLEEKIKTGKSKQIQLQDWERYFSYHKNSNKFVIDEIYEEVKEKMINKGGNNTPYIKYIEKLILDLLVQDLHKEEICLSKNKILKELKMINDNYVFCKYRVPKLSQFMKIESDTIDEWYESTDVTLKNNIEKALDNLKDQSLILWSSEISVCKIDVVSEGGLYEINKKVSIDEYDEEIISFKINAGHRYNFREATKEEKKFIIYTEREIMKEMGFKNKRDIVKCGLWKVFKDRINKILLKELNVNFHYNSYKILFNEEHIYEKYEELLDLLLTKEEREENQRQLNSAIIERLNNNIQKKQNRALEKTKNTFGIIKDKKLKRRISDNYIDNNTELINTLINQNSDDIKKKIKKTKVVTPNIRINI